MKTVPLVVICVGIGSMTMKAAGAVALGGRQLPARVARTVGLMSIALLGSLIAYQVFETDGRVTLDERVAGLGAAAVALARKLPTLAVVGVAAGATALVRASGS